MNKHSDDVSEWTSISDLMASLFSIVMLFLVYFVINSTMEKIRKSKEAQEKKQNAQMDLAEQLRDELDLSFAKVLYDSISGIIVLEIEGDHSFEQGKACVMPAFEKALTSDKFLERIANLVKGDSARTIQIEGHSDITNVSEEIVTSKYRHCAVFDDNFSLSAQRAKNVAKTILEKIKDPADRAEVNKRISVVGYGPNRLINPNNPTGAENRRVEIKIIPFEKSIERIN